jgi:hypothetical protein
MMSLSSSLARLIPRRVHFLDIGGIPVPERSRTVLGDLRHTVRNDDETARQGGKMFDLFYAAYAPPAAE